MSSVDRRDTRFFFVRKRSRPDDEGEDDTDGRGEGDIDHVDVIASKIADSRTKANTASTQATLNSHSLQNPTKSRTHHGSVEIMKLQIPQNQNPWKKFKPLLQVRQGCPAILARSIPPDQQLYAVRSIASTEKDKHLRAIQQLNLLPGRGIDQVRETFDWSGTLFVVTQYVKPSLSQIITSQDRPTEAHIAFIAQKILISLVLLEEQGLLHGSLDSSFVLIPPSCVPILAHPPYWRSIASSKQFIDTAALANLIVRLVERSVIIGSEEELHVREPHNWSPAIIDFIECARRLPASGLRDHAFLQLRCQPLDIQDLRSVADHTTWCHWQFLEPGDGTPE